MSQLPQKPTGSRYQHSYAAGLFPELLDADSTTQNPFATPPTTFNNNNKQPSPSPFDDYWETCDAVMSSETVELPSSTTTSSAHRYLCDTNVEPGMRAFVAATPSPRTLASDAVAKEHQLDDADVKTMLKTLQATVERILPRDENTAADAVKKKKASSSKKSSEYSRLAQEQRNMSHRITLLEESLVQIRDNSSHATRKVATEVRALAGEFSRHSARMNNIYEMVKTNSCIHHRK